VNCTKGEWIRGAGGSIEDKDGYPIAIVFPDTRLPSGDSIVKREANLGLIRTSVNACASINPDNPMAVVESIKDMYEALKELSEITHDLGLGDGNPDPLIEASNKKARKALAKAEGAK